MPPLTTQHAFDLALQHHQSGQLREAEQLYRQILAQHPAHCDAMHYLGLIAHQSGRNDIAVNLISRAIALEPAYAEAHYNLGLALQSLGQLSEAIAAYRQAIAINPKFAAAYNNLGLALKSDGQFDEAIAAFGQAIVLQPSYAEANSNLGNALGREGRYDEAIAAYRQAIAINPRYPEAHYNLGLILYDKRELDDSMAMFRQTIALRPDFAEAHNKFAAALRDAGQLDEAIAALRRAIALRPDYVEAHGNLIYALHLHPDSDTERLAGEHRRWNRQHAQPLRGLIRAHLNDRHPERRLRIGYVSPDFCHHPAGRFFIPLLDHHDRKEFEIFCYSDVLKPDSMTDRIRERSDHWRHIVGKDDEAVAAMIRQDEIDILVDLAMHTAGNRLLIFARKPAPVQVTYLAYCSSTGLETMDYRLTDRHLDPPAANGVETSADSNPCYSEQSIRLPDVYWCYEPQPNAPDVGPLPALAAGELTFGCLNQFAKISPQAFSAWGQLLRELPRSRLLLHARQGEHRRRTLDRFQQEGVDPARIAFVDFLHGSDYLRQYHQIDIGLDPFPYAGGATTCDALWMGVPIVTLAGRTAVGRSGVTLLNSVGLQELIAETREQYIGKALQLAADLQRLAELRAGLRDRMLKSPLMDAPRFARNVEAAYRWMWKEWCKSALGR